MEYVCGFASRENDRNFEEQQMVPNYCIVREIDRRTMSSRCFMIIFRRALCWQSVREKKSISQHSHEPRRQRSTRHQSFVLLFMVFREMQEIALIGCLQIMSRECRSKRVCDTRAISIGLVGNVT